MEELDLNNPQWYRLPEYIKAVKPYKSYVALLNQESTNAPVATVLENNLGGTVVWSRTNTGEYKATLTGAFGNAKTAVFMSVTSGGAGDTVQHVSTTDDVIGIASFDSGGLSDDLLANTSIEIRVYN